MVSQEFSNAGLQIEAADGAVVSRGNHEGAVRDAGRACDRPAVLCELRAFGFFQNRRSHHFVPFNAITS